MGIYKDIASVTEMINKGQLVNEVVAPDVTDTRDAVTKLYDILKTLRAIEYTIRNDEKIADDVYLPKIKDAIESAEAALNNLESIADDLEDLGF